MVAFRGKGRIPGSRYFELSSVLMTATKAVTEATAEAGSGRGARIFFKTSSMAASINDHFSGLIGCRRDWLWSQAASRSTARDLAREVSPDRSKRSSSSAMVLKLERSPKGLGPAGDIGVAAAGGAADATVDGR